MCFPEAAVQFEELSSSLLGLVFLWLLLDLWGQATSTSGSLLFPAHGGLRGALFLAH